MVTDEVFRSELVIKQVTHQTAVRFSHWLSGLQSGKDSSLFYVSFLLWTRDCFPRLCQIVLFQKGCLVKRTCCWSFQFELTMWAPSPPPHLLFCVISYQSVGTHCFDVNCSSVQTTLIALVERVVRVKRAQLSPSWPRRTAWCSMTSSSWCWAAQRPLALQSSPTTQMPSRNPALPHRKSAKMKKCSSTEAYQSHELFLGQPEEWWIEIGFGSKYCWCDEKINNSNVLNFSFWSTHFS